MSGSAAVSSVLAALIAGAAVLVAAPAARGQGDPAYTLLATPGGLAPGGFMAAPAAADFDGDGDIDVIAGDALGSVSYFRNTAGAGATPVYVELGPGENPLASASLGFAATVSAGDLDRDGDLDVLAGRGDGSFSYFQNTASAGSAPVFAAPVLNAFGLADVGSNSRPEVVDLDGDGDPDVLAGRTDGTIAYFENTAASGAPPAFVLRAGAANPLDAADVGWSSTPIAADLEGDGDLDVIVGDVLGALTLFANTAGPGAAPVFAPPVANPFGLADVGYSSAPAVVDLDRDGDLDVLAGTSVGTLAYFGNGAPGPLAVRLVGTEGWRMLASPIATVTLGSYLAPIWTQGVPGADNPGGAANVLRYDEAVTTDTDGDGDHDEDDGFVPPAAMSEASGAGRGVFVYVYEDDDMVTPGTQGGFPKTLTVAGPPRTTPFTWGVGATGADAVLTYTPSGDVASDGWNLLGSPYASWFDWDAAISVGMDAVVYVFDPAIASYRTYSRGVGGSLPGGVIGAFQAFWVHATSLSPRLTAPPAPADGGPIYGVTTEQTALVRLSLHPTDAGGVPATASSEVLLALGAEGALAGRDGADAYALAPPAQAFVYLASEAVDEELAAVALAVDVRPAPTGRTEVDLHVAGVAAGAPASGGYELRWPAPEGMPDGWTVRLLDRETGVETALDGAGAYTFALGGQPRVAGGRDSADAAGARLDPPALAPRALVGGGHSRFALVVEPGVVTDAPTAPAAFALSAVRPNPTSANATLTLTLSQSSDVTVVLVDVLGRRVAVIAYGPRPAGAHELSVDTAALPPGAYAIHAEVRGAAGARLVRRLVVAR